jgi:hypothetical protein
LDFTLLEINLIQHYSFPDTGDNWDIQALAVSAADSGGTVLLASRSNLPINGNNCMARLSETTSSASYGLSISDPLNFNVVNPFSSVFGPTPPGNCPQ